MEPVGYISLVLHGHLPFVRHPEHDDFFEERWLYEAITECYLPLLEMGDSLLKQKIPMRMALSLSPTLVAMLMDPLLQQRYLRHISKLVELSEKELARTSGTDYFPVAQMYHRHFSRCQERFVNAYGGNILKGFKMLQDVGAIELFTTAATHGFFPFYRSHPAAVTAQIRMARIQHREVFGRDPQGIWLPECAFFPELEPLLKAEGIRYFFLEQHGLEYAEPRPRYGVYSPIFTPQGIAAFGRDPLCSEQVWSGQVGYPSDPVYREYYRDIGWDLDYGYIRNYIHEDGNRINTGIKYYRITGDNTHKQVYNRTRALLRAQVHAENFLYKNFQRLKQTQSSLGIVPHITAPYDAELFGHWWFEGPNWLECVFRTLANQYPRLQAITPSEYLDSNPVHQACVPATSSWGDRGYNRVWINDSNSWVYRHLLLATEEMIELARANPAATGPMEVALNQAAREILLAQSSDWPFLISTGGSVGYAEKRLKGHLGRFQKIVRSIREGKIDLEWLAAIEFLDNIFPQLSYKIYL